MYNRELIVNKERIELQNKIDQLKLETKTINEKYEIQIETLKNKISEIEKLQYERQNEFNSNILKYKTIVNNNKNKIII